MQLTLGKLYEVTEQLTTPVVDGHEIGGIWSEHASVQLDPGERFKVTHDTGGDGWYIARMFHPLRFNVGTVGEVTWQGSFHIHSRDLEKLKEFNK